MEEIFKKIEDNIFETQQEKDPDKENKDTNQETTKDSTYYQKNEKSIINTEIKNNRQSKLHLEKPDDIIEEKEKLKDIDENVEEKRDKENDFDDDEYSDYGRIDKTGIHFQIISDSSVSIEIVPNELLRDDIKEFMMIQ